MIQIGFNEKNEKIISVTGRSDFFCAKVNNITHITCKEYECTVHLTNGIEYTTVHLLREFEEKLEKHNFFQTYRHTLINVEHFISAKITHKESTVNVNGIIIKIAKRKVALLKKMIYDMLSACDS